MKPLILAYLFLVFLALSANAQTLSANDRAARGSLNVRLANYKIKASPQVIKSMLADLETFGTLELSEKNDLELTKNALTTLLVMDKYDKSRTGTEPLSQSYLKFKPLYKKAAAEIQNSENKERLNEYLEILESFHSDTAEQK